MLTEVKRNVMEVVVAEEIEAQMLSYPSNMVKNLNRVEVATYALNRLPALYASSQEGFQWQIKRAKKEYKNQIHLAVQQGFAAVLRDPLRRSTPLKDEKVSAHKDSYSWKDSIYRR